MTNPHSAETEYEQSFTSRGRTNARRTLAVPFVWKTATDRITTRVSFTPSFKDMIVNQMMIVDTEDLMIRAVHVPNDVDPAVGIMTSAFPYSRSGSRYGSETAINVAWFTETTWNRLPITTRYQGGCWADNTFR